MYYFIIIKNILERERLVVYWNEYLPVVNVVRFGRSFQLFTINKNKLDRVRLVISLKDSLPDLNVSSLGRSIHLIHYQLEYT